MDSAKEHIVPDPHAPEEPVLVKPTPTRPMLVPQLSFSCFASPEAQKALVSLDGESEGDDETSDKKREPEENYCGQGDTELDGEKNDDASMETHAGLRSRYRWRVVSKSVRNRRMSDPSLSTLNQMSKAGKPEENALCFGRTPAPPKSPRTLSPQKLSRAPCPPKTPRARRMSLSTCQHPLIPNRQKSKSDASLNMTGTGSKSTDSSEFSTEIMSTSSSTESLKSDISGKDHAYAPLLLRRRLSLPVNTGKPLLSPRSLSPMHPGAAIYERRSSFPAPSSSSPTPSVSSCRLGRRQSSGDIGPGRTSVASLQANREKLESLMRERSRAVAQLSVKGDGSSESPLSPIPSPAPPTSIRSKHSITRPLLCRSPSLPVDSCSDIILSETSSLQDDDSPHTRNSAELDNGPRLSSDVTTTIEAEPSSPPTRQVASDAAKSSDDPLSVSSTTLALIRARERPVFRRRGSGSIDTVISVIDSMSSPASDLEPSLVEFEKAPRISRRRRSICLGSLSSLLASSSSPGRSTSGQTSQPPDGTTVPDTLTSPDTSSPRSDHDIKQNVEAELQRRIVKTKSQLLMQAAPGTSSVNSAVARLEARAICKTTNGRLRKMMGSLTQERTTSELLIMKAATNAMSNETSGT